MKLNCFYKLLRVTLCLVSPFCLVGCFGEQALAPVVNAWYLPSANHNTYRVRRGDTIYSIAWAFGLDYRTLAAVNHLRAPYRIREGQLLKMTAVRRGAGESVTPKPIQEAPKSSLFRAKKKYVKPVKISKRSIKSVDVEVPTSALKWQWPAKGNLIQRFKPGIRGSQGIAIGGRFGQSVRAAASGVVVYSGDGVRGYGNLVIIKHNRHYLSAYAFNKKNLVKVGDRVQVGSIIAQMGRNDAGQTLLYFEIRYNGKPVNPLRFLR